MWEQPKWSSMPDPGKDRRWKITQWDGSWRLMLYKSIPDPTFWNIVFRTPVTRTRWQPIKWSGYQDSIPHVDAVANLADKMLIELNESIELKNTINDFNRTQNESYSNSNR